MLGISVYLSQLDEKYLKKAHENGARYVFTSLHIPEENLSDLENKVHSLLSNCQEYHLMVVSDISPETFKMLKLPNQDFSGLKKLGFKALRLDYGFDDLSLVKKLLMDFDVFLNASLITDDYLTACERAGIDIHQLKYCHNFYPKTQTGVSEDFFLKLNQPLIERGLETMAFVPGDQLRRFPLYEGLPTIEHHRGKNPYVAAVELRQKFGVKDIVIGDSFAKINTLSWIDDFLENHILTLPVWLNERVESLFDNLVPVRRDLSENVVRLNTPRIPEIQIAETGDRYPGVITMENELGKRYSGEIQICKKTLPVSSSSNLVGFVHPEYIDLLKYIDAKTKLKFVPLSES